MIKTVADLIEELKKYPSDMEIFYTTKYALIPLTVKSIENRCVYVDLDEEWKEIYEEE